MFAKNENGIAVELKLPKMDVNNMIEIAIWGMYSNRSRARLNLATRSLGKESLHQISYSRAAIACASQIQILSLGVIAFNCSATRGMFYRKQRALIGCGLFCVSSKTRP